MILAADAEPALVAREAGGKGRNLFLLARAGLRVPRFFALGLSAFDEHLARHGIVAGEGAAEKILAAPLPPAVAESLRAAARRLGTRRLAVRSSAAAEDGAAHSFAGQLESFLYVDPDGVPDAVRRCWASAFSPHALAYTKTRGIDPAGARVAVVVQAMVDADVAGVTFTVDAISGDHTRMVVSAVRGLGEGLVSGALDADSFFVDRGSGAVVEQRLCGKPLRYVEAPGGGTAPASVPAALVDAPTLDASALRALHEAALAVERACGGAPQDIEWAFSGGTLHLLQARPITARAPAAPQAAARRPVQVWDNANIVESYAGVTSPLTFTFARNAYFHVYVQFCQVMGVPARTVRAMEPVLRHMLGYVDGRIYYNLLNWYALVGLFPGFRHNKQFMEGMMGVRESLPPEAQALVQLPGRATFRDRARQLWLGVRMAGRFFGLARQVAGFRAHFDAAYARFLREPFEGKPLEELLAIYDEMDAAFLRHWKAPIVNDFFAMIFFGVLRGKTRTWLGDEAGTLQNDLLCGEGGIESTLPTEALLALGAVIDANPAWRALFRSESAAALSARVRTDPALGPLRAQIDDYLARFGFRCMNELKLEEPDLHTDPGFVFQTLKNYATQAPPSVEALRAREREIRARAEARVTSTLGPARRRIFGFVLRHARRTVKNRENLRFARTKVFGLVRRLMNAIGADLVRRRRLEAAADVYFLTLEELRGLVDGTLVTRDLGSLVATRKKDRAAYLAASPSDRFVTRGAIASEAGPPAAPGGGDDLLRGTGCCPGQVAARAKVVTGPRGDLALGGQILVAERTDPGWTPLFPSASGILVERGSLLSHSAIVARELGIPCVVGLAGLMARVRTGDALEMDGAAGTARIVAPARQSDADAVSEGAIR